MKRLLLLFALISPASAAMRYVDGDPLRPEDRSAINQNFREIDNELSNTVHKTSTETIRGFKYFTNNTDFYAVTGDTATFAYSVYMATSSGSVGIGTGSPDGKLDVRGIGDGESIYLHSTTNMGTAGNDLSLVFRETGEAEVVRVQAITESSSNIGLALLTRGSNVMAERVRVEANGNVGISTTIPSTKLEISGTANGHGVYVNNNISGNVQTIFAAGDSSVGAYIAGATKPDGTTSRGGDFGGRIILQGSSGSGIQFQTSAVASGAHSWVDRFFIGHNGRSHVYPSGSADVELEVSNGASTGGGTAHAASFAAHSSRSLKSDIRYLSLGEKLNLYNDLKTLKPAEFRYKVNRSADTPPVPDPTQPLRRGLILEDAPASLRQPHDPEAIALNDQIFMLQAAIQVLINKVEALEQVQAVSRGAGR